MADYSSILKQYFPQYFEEIKLPQTSTLSTGTGDASGAGSPSGTGEILKLLDEVIQRYRPGGKFGKAEESLLGRKKVKSLASTRAGLVGAGLTGTTVGAGAGKKWEEEVGMPARLQLEDTRTQRLMEALQAKAGYMEREDTRTAEERRAQEALELQRQLALEQLKQEQLRGQQGLSISGRVEPREKARSGSSVTGGAGAGAGGAYGGDYGGMGSGYGGGAGAGSIGEGGFSVYEGGQARPAGREGWRPYATPTGISWLPPGTGSHLISKPGDTGVKEARPQIPLQALADEFLTEKSAANPYGIKR